MFDVDGAEVKDKDVMEVNNNLCEGGRHLSHPRREAACEEAIGSLDHHQLLSFRAPCPHQAKCSPLQMQGSTRCYNKGDPVMH